MIKYVCRIVLCTTIFVLSGCSSDDNATEGESLNSVAFSVGYVGAESFDLTDRALELDDRLVFRLIPGFIFGFPVDGNIIDIPINGADEVDITFSENIFTDNSQPAILTLEAANNGFTIEPGDTKFGRLGSFYTDSEGTNLPGGYALYDYETEMSFLITYFDRAATFKGVDQRDDDGDYREFDVEVPGAGFYALGGSWTQNDDGTFRFLYQVLDIQGDALFYIHSQ